MLSYRGLTVIYRLHVMTVTDHTPPAAVSTGVRRWPVDPEHGLLRLAVILTFVGGSILSYIVFTLLFPQGDGGAVNLLGVAVAIGIAMLLTRAIEGGLKRRWPSGRVFEIDGSTIRLTGKGTPTEIDGAQHVNVLTWRFTISRRTRVPKGWFVVALALVQNDLYLPVYTFMSPDEFNSLRLNSHFSTLAPAKQKDKGDLRLAGQQRRLRTAEYARWNDGGELSKDHFIEALDALGREFPAWMISE